MAAVILGMATGLQARTLKIATIAPEGTTWMKEFRAAAAEIAERTEGRVKIKFYPGGVMGSGDSIYQKIRVGQLQGGAFTGAELERVYSGVNVYSLPMLFHSYDEVAYVL